MKIVIPGGAGQIGGLLASAFHGAGHEVVVLSRQVRSAPWRGVQWDGRTVGAWAAELEGADVVINLAGRSVDCRYHATNRRLILESRVESVRAVGEAIGRAKRPPRVWLQAGTATIYSHRFDANNDDVSGILGGAEAGLPDTWRFSYEVARAWEEAVDEARTPVTRKVILRSAMVMSPSCGGVFDVLLRLVRFGMGGAAGDGRQFVSWIHDADFFRAVNWLIEHEELAGAVVLAAPEPIPYAEFMRELRGAWGRRFGMGQPRWLVEVGAFFIRTESELVLKSRRVASGRLTKSGFEFGFAKWKEAARDLCERWREGMKEHTLKNDASGIGA